MSTNGSYSTYYSNTVEVMSSADQCSIIHRYMELKKLSAEDLKKASGAVCLLKT